MYLDFSSFVSSPNIHLSDGFWLKLSALRVLQLVNKQKYSSVSPFLWAFHKEEARKHSESCMYLQMKMRFNSPITRYPKLQVLWSSVLWPMGRFSWKRHKWPKSSGVLVLGFIIKWLWAKIIDLHTHTYVGDCHFNTSNISSLDSKIG